MGRAGRMLGLRGRGLNGSIGEPRDCPEGLSASGPGWPCVHPRPSRPGRWAAAQPSRPQCALLPVQPELPMTPLETVQHMYAAFGRGDVPAILACLAEDVQWEYGERGPSPAPVPWLQPRRGRDAVIGFFEALTALEFSRFVPHKLLADGAGDRRCRGGGGARRVLRHRRPAHDPLGCSWNLAHPARADRPGRTGRAASIGGPDAASRKGCLR